MCFSLLADTRGKDWLAGTIDESPTFGSLHGTSISYLEETNTLQLQIIKRSEDMECDK